MTFKGFDYGKRLLDRPEYFHMLQGKKISAMLPRSCKKSSNNGIVKPTKMIRCNECKDGNFRTVFNNRVNENKEFEGNLSLLKGKAPNQFGHMFPYYVK